MIMSVALYSSFLLLLSSSLCLCFLGMGLVRVNLFSIMAITAIILSLFRPELSCCVGSNLIQYFVYSKFRTVSISFTHGLSGIAITLPLKLLSLYGLTDPSKNLLYYFYYVLFSL